MRCISPLRLKSGQDVPCGKCNFCLQSRRLDWTFRIAQEWKVSSTSYFLTMTYEDEQLPHRIDSHLPTLVKEHHVLFMKRLRKWNPIPIRFYMVGEYGTETQRPHYHYIIFNLVDDVVSQIDMIWQLGFVRVDKVAFASIHYVTKYHVNRFGDYKGRDPPFCAMSRRPGIGTNYLRTHLHWHRVDMKNYVQVNGILGRLPRFYKEKIFTDLERQRLAIEALRLGDLKYLEEVERLCRFSDDPFTYYEQCVAHSHDAIIHKANVLNKF